MYKYVNDIIKEDEEEMETEDADTTSTDPPEIPVPGEIRHGTSF